MSTNIQFPQGPMVDPNTGMLNLEWFLWLQNPQFLSLSFASAIGVTSGGTGLTGGTSGGVLAFTGAATLASSGVLTNHALVTGGGAGGVPATLASLGTTTTVLHGNAAGAPSFSAVSLTADVSGVLPIANGGTNAATASANTMFAGPTTGSAAAPSFRVLVPGDLPVSTLTNSISGNVSLSNTANYFDGPSVAQGSSGVWFASGTIIVNDTAAAAQFFAKLWDGTTVADSANVTCRTPGAGTGDQMLIALSGVFTNPQGNIRISARDATNATGVMLANASGNGKDSTITLVRIG